MSALVDEAFAELGRFWPGFEPRAPQRSMAHAVFHTLRHGGHLAVEAPTGVGKSVAYLVPALLAARHDGRRIVISTHTKNLQAQIVTRDAPRVRDVVAPDVKLAVLKGRANYLCQRRLSRVVQAELFGGERAEFLDRFSLWAERTSTGDLEEFGATDAREWAWLRELAAPEAMEETAPCQRAARCFLRESRRRAAASEIVIVNHALLLTHHLTPAQVLPEYDILIVDEAHTLPEVAGRALERRVAPSTLRAALQRATGGPDLRLLEEVRKLWERSPEGLRPQQVQDVIADVVRALTRVRRLGDGAFRALARRLGGVERRYRRRDAEEGFLPPELDDLIGALAELSTGFARVREGMGSAVLVTEDDEETLLRFTLGAATIEEFRRSVRFTVEVSEPSYVYWYESNPEPALVAAPLRAGEALASACFRRMDRLVFTSATLSTVGSFDHFLGSIGLAPGAVETLATETPFPLEEQVTALAPPMPPPDSPALVGETAAFLAELARSTERKVLALFTSHEQLRQVHGALVRTLEGSGILVFGQSIDGSRERVTQAFRRSRGGVLLGTASFWEGVDFPGEELEVLVMARLPFPVPTHPIVEARCEEIAARGGAPFAELMIPEAVLRFRQGFGRLIRRGTDRGVFIVLDSRIRSATYRSRFERALPVHVVATENPGEALALAREWFSPAARADRDDAREERCT